MSEIHYEKMLEVSLEVFPFPSFPELRATGTRLESSSLSLFLASLRRRQQTRVKPLFIIYSFFNSQQMLELHATRK
jgi:hypothetical protein